jgi:hypothetical protein
VVLLHQAFLGEQFGRRLRRQGLLWDFDFRIAARRRRQDWRGGVSLDTKYPVFASIAISNGMLYFAALGS